MTYFFHLFPLIALNIVRSDLWYGTIIVCLFSYSKLITNTLEYNSHSLIYYNVFICNQIGS